MDQERNRGRGECAREGIGGASGNEIRSNRLLRMQFVGWAAGITDQRVVCFQGVDGICSRIGERDVVHGEGNKTLRFHRATRVNYLRYRHMLAPSWLLCLLDSVFCTARRGGLVRTPN
ncbi:hypothetical protein B296_00038181 [Ensete ventricosum]|uniref:Uncharacterized protein n=1 Tax=Ensete ventricosum TaxID=4639 RepID=A0A426Z9P3_ENSVE|nr:hypothetical protein B296_00038181 [Ensete ventricosum]